MNIVNHYLKTEFGPETRFEIRPTPPTAFRALQESQFERLKSLLLAERLSEVWGARSVSQVRRAANEAAALAWVTPYPLLLFPVLFEEKSDEVLHIADRQIQVRERSRELLML